MIYRQQTLTQEKAQRIRAGLSNILCNYVLASSIQLAKLADSDHSISRASYDTRGV